MGITIRQNFAEFPSRLLTRDTMREMGLLARETILRRTAAGKDKDGKPFAPYSLDYAQQKQDALGTGGTPDLTVSGRMLGDLAIMDYSVTSDGGKGVVKLGFTS